MALFTENVKEIKGAAHKKTVTLTGWVNGPEVSKFFITDYLDNYNFMNVAEVHHRVNALRLSNENCLISGVPWEVTQS